MLNDVILWLSFALSIVGAALGILLAYWHHHERKYREDHHHSIADKVIDKLDGHGVIELSSTRQGESSAWTMPERDCT